MAKALKRFLVSTSLNNWNQKLQQKPTIRLTREETHHLKNVLRIKEGKLCLLFDREGNEFVSKLERFLPDSRSQMRLMESTSFQKNEILKLSVAQAIPQDRKMDEIVEKSAELGVFELIPLETEHTVVKIAAERFKKVRARWERIAEQTLKQSRLRNVPQIAALTSFSELCSRSSQYDQIFLFHPSQEAKSLKEYFPVQMSESKIRILLMIGPEGGFSEKEIDQSRAVGAKTVRMGSAGILKTDTAFVAAVSFFRFMYP